MKKCLLIPLVILVNIFAFTACGKTTKIKNTNAQGTPVLTEKQTIEEKVTPDKNIPTMAPSANPDINEVVPIFSKQAGFYTNPFTLTLQVGELYKGTDLTIKYTLNGKKIILVGKRD